MHRPRKGRLQRILASCYKIGPLPIVVRSISQESIMGCLRIVSRQKAPCHVWSLLRRNCSSSTCHEVRFLIRFSVTSINYALFCHLLGGNIIMTGRLCPVSITQPKPKAEITIQYRLLVILLLRSSLRFFLLF